MRKIDDEFAGLKISRQRKYQLRKEAQGKCRICGRPKWKKTASALCKRHWLNEKRGSDHDELELEAADTAG